MKLRKNKLDIPDSSRRNFMKWGAGLGAALGLEPWRIFEVEESLFGTAFAQDAACAPVNRFVGNVMGNGGLAWMTQLFPFADQATQNGRSFYATGQATDQLVEAGDHPMKLGPHAPNFGGRRVTGFIAGRNETHTGQPNSTAAISGNTSLFAAVASLQLASPTLVPAIAVGNVPYGAAPGAPSLTRVGQADEMVGLFNSAASTAGSALAEGGDAQVFEALYKANLGFRRAAQRATVQPGHRTGQTASNLLGKNLADALRPSDADLTRYGIERGTPDKLSNIARTLITTAKGFKLNLMNSVMLPGMNDDPHGAFGNRGDLERTVMTLGRIWTAFYADMQNEVDPVCSGAKLADNLVVAWVGDTPKNPNNPDGWGDGTPGDSNWMYVVGGGLLRSGWFGDVKGNGNIETWNPANGQNVPGGNSEAMAPAASAAVLYAVTRGDMRRVSELYKGESIDGVVIPRTQ